MTSGTPNPPSDPGRLEELFKRHVESLQAFVRRRARELLQRESGSDLVQSVCREVLQDARAQKWQDQGDAAFKRWLFEAAQLKIGERRRYWNRAKRAGTPARGEAPEADDPGEARRAAFLTSVCTPSHGAARREELRLAESAFAELDDASRQVIVWARIEELSHKEIAQRLGVSEANSRMQLSRALVRFTSIARKRIHDGHGDASRRG